MRPDRSSRPPRQITGRAVFLGFLAFFGTITAMNVVMITLAVGSFPGVEVDSSYKAGQNYPAELAQARAQADLGWRVTAHAARDADGGADVAISVIDRDGAPLSGLTGSVMLKRPAASGLDRETGLVAVGAGRYAGRAVDVAPGVYDLVVELDGSDGRRFRSVNRLMLAGDVP